MPGIARLNAGVVRIGRQLVKRRNIMWGLEFDLSLEQNSPDQPEKRVQNGRSATRLIVASRFELPLLGSNQDSPDPESGVLPVTPRGIGTKTITGGRFGLWKPEKPARYAVRGCRRQLTCVTAASPTTGSNRARRTAHPASRPPE